jgi:hypothetical protein
MNAVLEKDIQTSEGLDSLLRAERMRMLGRETRESALVAAMTCEGCPEPDKCIGDYASIDKSFLMIEGCH